MVDVLQVHEVLVSNDDPGSVITWDFDVMRQDVMFTVYRTLVPVAAQSPSGKHCEEFGWLLF